MYGTGQAGSANGYVSAPAEPAPMFRGEIRNRVYQENMAPSQQGPYGSLGGSGGRAGRMAQLVQQQNSMGSGRNEEFAALPFEEKMKIVRGNLAGAKGYSSSRADQLGITQPERPVFRGGVNDTMVPDPSLTDAQRQTMWMQPAELAQRNANRAAQMARMAQQKKLRQQVFAERSVRSQFGGALPSEMAPFTARPGAAGTPGSSDFNPESQGWVPPAADATPEDRANSLSGLVGFLDDPGMTLDKARSRLGRFNRDELGGVLNDNTGWGPGGDSVWDHIGGGGIGGLIGSIPGLGFMRNVMPGDAADPNSPLNQKRQIRQILGQYLNPQQQSGIRPLGIAVAPGMPGYAEQNQIRQPAVPMQRRGLRWGPFGFSR
jgi:hypothetical protein